MAQKPQKPAKPKPGNQDAPQPAKSVATSAAGAAAPKAAAPMAVPAADPGAQLVSVSENLALAAEALREGMERADYTRATMATANLDAAKVNAEAAKSLREGITALAAGVTQLAALTAAAQAQGDAGGVDTLARTGITALKPILGALPSGFLKGNVENHREIFNKVCRRIDGVRTEMDDAA